MTKIYYTFTGYPSQCYCYTGGPSGYLCVSPAGCPPKLASAV
jgi:hypothetical protein